MDYYSEIVNVEGVRIEGVSVLGCRIVIQSGKVYVGTKVCGVTEDGIVATRFVKTLELGERLLRKVKVEIKERGVWRRLGVKEIKAKGDWGGELMYRSMRVEMLVGARSTDGWSVDGREVFDTGTSEWLLEGSIIRIHTRKGLENLMGLEYVETTNPLRVKVEIEEGVSMKGVSASCLLGLVGGKVYMSEEQLKQLRGLEDCISGEEYRKDWDVMIKVYGEDKVRYYLKAEKDV